MLKITLKDGSVLEMENGATCMDVALKISEGLARVALVAKVNGEVVDLYSEIKEDATLELCTFDSEEGKHAFRHSASHVLAQAVKRLYPDAKLAIGPAIENGFYYDFDAAPFTAEDLKKIEAEMKKIAHCLALTAKDFENTQKEVRETVAEICRKFPLYG